MWNLLITIICFTINDRHLITAGILKNLSNDSVMFDNGVNIPIDFPEYKIENTRLIEQWQDWMLSNVICVNYINTLMALSSSQDYALSIPDGYRVKYVNNTKSFRQTMSQLSSATHSALNGARADINRVYTGMERVPYQLKTVTLLLKQASIDLLRMLLPDSFDSIEKLVNDSLIILKRPEENFRRVLDLVEEIDYLLNTTAVNQITNLQVTDVKIQWRYLTEFIAELSKRAKRACDSFLLQLNWILGQIIRPDVTFVDSYRDFIISVLLPKITEIDRTTDLLGTITKVYTDISFKYTDEQISSYVHLLLLANDQDRKRYLKQFRYDLLPQVVYIARLSLERHKQFLQRDKSRPENYKKSINDFSSTDLMDLLDSTNKQINKNLS